MVTQNIMRIAYSNNFSDSPRGAIPREHWQKTQQLP